ncbi:MAG: radical SAM family heme chaperone HemW [Muribaculaceae bacterium]|nr:radical SAM family heme chaperone HemW [Muribaculaceae bacterium]MDE5929895.1 radical SAM family heme chaperone HemW [Muribaculaceae bacterium]
MAGLYIHIPYCHSKCAYCDFYSRPDDGNAGLVADTIVKEFRLRKHEFAEPITTIYIGGGTPSILPDRLLGDIVKGIGIDSFDIKEFTIEVNPEDIYPEKLKFWKALGIDRISMGVQSLCDAELKAVGRRHSAQTALDALDMIREAGFTKISCDLIYGLPGQSVYSWQESLTRLLDTGITHLSAYSLTYEQGTLLYARMLNGKVIPADDDTVLELYSILCDETAARGFRHYEISNFALPAYEAIHNSSYWNDTPYLGLGPSAHSFDGHTRRINPASVRTYIENMPAFEIEAESEIDRLNDRIITALRTDRGLELNSIPHKYRSSIERYARIWVNRSMLEYRGDVLIIPERHWMMADAIMRDLILTDSDQTDSE